MILQKMSKKKAIALSLFVFCVLSLNAQDYCQKTSIYFDLNKSDLKKDASKRIDSLVQTLDEDSYVMELYGYSDTLASNEYNLKLSSKRISTVKSYISRGKKIKFTFLEKNLGEDDDLNTSKDLALSRRVDIFLFPLKNNKLVFSNENERAELAIDYFEPCGICNSKPVLKGYYTEDDAGKDKIKFQTKTLENLLTVATLKLDYKACPQAGERKNDTVTFKVSAAWIDKEMTVWEPDPVKGLIYWKKSGIKPVFDTVNNIYIISSTQLFLCLCKPWNGLQIRSKLIFPDKFSPVRSYLSSGETKTKVWRTQIVENEKTDSYAGVNSFGKMDGNYYYLAGKLGDYLHSKDSSLRTGTLTKTYNMPLDAYKEFTFSDTALKIKFKKKLRPEKIGFFLKDVNGYVPVDADVSQKWIITKKPNDIAKKTKDNYQLAIVKNKKLYVVKPGLLKMKYKKRKKAYVMKINKKSYVNFKTVKTVEPEDFN
jgi:hypothetical protein